MNTMHKLYHGTTQECADALCRDGWQPLSYSRGSQCGNPKFLYLTNHPENALWYAEQKGGGAVVEINVADDLLLVDPEDGTCDSVEEELSGSVPGSVVIFQPILAEAFRRIDRDQILHASPETTKRSAGMSPT